MPRMQDAQTTYSLTLTEPLSVHCHRAAIQHSEDNAVAALRNTRPHEREELLVRSDDKVWIRGAPVVDVVNAGDLRRLVHAQPLEPVQCVEQHQTARMHTQVFEKLMWRGSNMHRVCTHSTGDGKALATLAQALDVETETQDSGCTA